MNNKDLDQITIRFQQGFFYIFKSNSDCSKAFGVLLIEYKSNCSVSLLLFVQG